MALSLQDFNKPATTQELRMNAFQPRTRTSPGANQATINTLASYAAALDPMGDLEGAYNSVTNQLSYSSSSDTLDRILRQWDENDVVGTMDTLRGVLINPDIGDVEKQEILYGFQTGQWSTSMASKVAQTSGSTPSEGENGEQENLRVRISAAFDEVDQYNAWVQKNINAMNSENNPNWATAVKGLAESLIPFGDAARQAMFEQIVDVEGTGDAGSTIRTLLLLGEGRQDLRDTLARIPVNERQAVVQNIISVIKSSAGSNTNSVEVMRQLEIMNMMLTPGGYDDADRWADNIFSIMDDTILLAPFAKGFGAVRAAARGASEARVAEEVIARGERSLVNAEPQLMIEYKPSPVSYGDDIDRIVDNLPVEPTHAEITNLRDAIMGEIGNANFSIDNVIDNLTIGDRLTSTQITDIRQALGNIRDKRTADLNANIPEAVPTISEARRAHISGNVQPTSVSQIHKDTNPAQARISHNAVVADESGQAAKVLYGTDRNSAIGNDFAPEIGGPDGRVRAKMEFDEATAVPDQRILRNIKDGDGKIWADNNEKKELQNRVVKEWRNTMGVTNRSAMASLSDINPSIGKTSAGLRFNQVFGPRDGGFSNAFTGAEQVKAALRKYGVTDDEVIILSRQSDGNYGPANPKQDMSNGDFLIQVKHDYEFDPSEIKYEGFQVSKLWGFINIPDIGDLRLKTGSSGGVVQQIVPKAVNIDKRAYNAGVSAADKASGLGQQLQNYQKRMLNKWNRLDKVQKELVDKYIRDANDQELTFNTGKIRALGINDAGVEMLVDWKTVQDTLYTLENADTNRTLRSRGYEYFVNADTDTRILVQPVARSNVSASTELYDVATDSFITLTQKNLDELYERGGNVVSPRNGEDFIQGRRIEFILNPNNASGYSRRIRDNDNTLNYRQGYYHVRYDDPYYITSKGKDGRVRTIARAESRRDAEAEVRRLRDTQDGNEYDWKPDRNASQDEQFDNNLSVAFASGRSAQRLRGNRLRRVGSDKSISDVGLESPIDSLTRSISSIATRTNFRNVLDADKRRWMSQFKHLLPNDVHSFPKSIDQIRSGDASNEAKHAYRYITGLQDGYANLMDDVSKAFFNKVSDVTDGKKGWGWLDKVASKAARVSPAAGARLTAFKLFLASNPIGQLPLQMMPAVAIVSSLNPTGWGRVVKQAGVLGAWHRGVDVGTTMKTAKYTGLKTEDMKEIVKDYELSGMNAAVNAHSYINDDFGRMANRNVVQKGLSVLGKPLRVAQSIGFDFGEQSLMTLTWLSERDRLTKQLGRNTLTAAEREQLTAKVRALTGDMNKGGEMPYNSNTLSVIMQFLQSPHKIASGLLLGHRGIDWKDRAKLIAGYTAVFGVPAIPVIDSFVDKMMPPDNPEAREIVKGGLTNLVLNRFLSSMTGEDVNVDFSGRLQPFTTQPLTEFAHGVLTTSIPEMIAGSAAPSLISEGGRVGEFMKAIAAPFIPGEYEGVDEYKQIGLTFLQMFTGLSNTMKAQYMLELGKITTRSGQTVDDDISFTEALMKAAGFQTIDEVRYWESNKIQWETSDQIDQDIQGLVDELFVRYTREGQDIAGFEQYQRVMAEASRVFGNNPVYMEKIADYYQFKANQSPDALFNRLFKDSRFYHPDQAIKMINASNMSQDQIDSLMELYSIAGESYGD